MKNIQLLASIMATSLLTACGSTSSTASIGAGPISNTQSPLPQNYEVPTELQAAVRDALKFKVNWEPLDGDKPLKLGDKTYNTGEYFDFTTLKLGYSVLPHTWSNKEEKFKEVSKVATYRLPYSIIMSSNSIAVTRFPGHSYGEQQGPDGADAYYGFISEAIPESGKATYIGKSLYQNELGNFKLAVDFGTKSTEGSITGLSIGDVTLHKGKIETVLYEGINEDKRAPGFKGNATLAGGKTLESNYTVTESGVTKNIVKKYDPKNYNFEYVGNFFGPNAEEAAGLIQANDKAKSYPTEYEVISFAGQRGEIK